MTLQNRIEDPILISLAWLPWMPPIEAIEAIDPDQSSIRPLNHQTLIECLK